MSFIPPPSSGPVQPGHPLQPPKQPAQASFLRRAVTWISSCWSNKPKDAPQQDGLDLGDVDTLSKAILSETYGEDDYRGSDEKLTQTVTQNPTDATTEKTRSVSSGSIDTEGPFELSTSPSPTPPSTRSASPAASDQAEGPSDIPPAPDFDLPPAPDLDDLFGDASAEIKQASAPLTPAQRHDLKQAEELEKNRLERANPDRFTIQQPPLKVDTKILLDAQKLIEAGNITGATDLLKTAAQGNVKYKDQQGIIEELKKHTNDELFILLNLHATMNPTTKSAQGAVEVMQDRGQFDTAVAGLQTKAFAETKPLDLGIALRRNLNNMPDGQAHLNIQRGLFSDVIKKVISDFDVAKASISPANFDKAVDAHFKQTAKTAVSEAPKTLKTTKEADVFTKFLATPLEDVKQMLTDLKAAYKHTYADPATRTKILDEAKTIVAGLKQELITPYHANQHEWLKLLAQDKCIPDITKILTGRLKLGEDMKYEPIPFKAKQGAQESKGASISPAVDHKAAMEAAMAARRVKAEAAEEAEAKKTAQAKQNAEAQKAAKPTTSPTTKSEFDQWLDKL